MGEVIQKFDEFFCRATKAADAPFPFQTAFATASEIPSLVQVPTGLGKTAMAVIGWLWRRNHAGPGLREATPRRLVYCLPMRALVEQTRENAEAWRAAAGLADQVDVPVLMGGEEKSDWDTNPERDAIIIGTQDMLISRALNRGYAMSRARWPMAFGLLNTDSLWVFDEIQLMGSGLATTAQLEAFRHSLGAKDGNGCRSVWMSATMQPDWLGTVDFKAKIPSLPLLKLEDEDQQHFEIKKRRSAAKPLKQAKATMGDAADLATEIRAAHKVGTLTIVVMNTVKRACELFDQMNKSAVPAKATGKKTVPVAAPVVFASPKLVLLHSRFRPDDRELAMKAATDPPIGDGTIVISTQVIEAGVDMSATTLFTELAPWTSLVQRFGRCNRFGTANELASVRWIGLPAAEKDAEKVRFPYELSDLRAAEKQLRALKDVGVQSLPHVTLTYKHTHVIRRKDLIDLFDTTADLAGNDIDIDRFVREIEETDVRVFWREWDQPKGFEPPPSTSPSPHRNELCSAPVGDFRDFAKEPKRKNSVWRWDFLDEVWMRAEVAPGQVYLVHADAGGYSPSSGWDSNSPDRVQPIASLAKSKTTPNEGTESEDLSHIGVWQTIAQHTDDVCNELDRILKHLKPREAAQLRLAARWHDWGKAHSVFQQALPNGAPIPAQYWAKAVRTGWKRYTRKHFRHELASAIAVLDPTNRAIDDEVRDLVAYLIAAHHGKVRLSIRSLPEESRPAATGRTAPRFARGVWDADTLPHTNLGGGVMTHTATLSLEPMELGLCESAPFTDQPSWLERMLGLRDTLGPFHLAYLEAILRAADMRASAAAAKGAAHV